MKASLLSALVFPGIGHLYLKKYFPGTALAAIAVGSLYFLLSTGIERAVKIVEQIQLGEVQPDIATIVELVSRQATGSDARLINISSTVFFLSWIIGIVDSYLAGSTKKSKV